MSKRTMRSAGLVALTALSTCALSSCGGAATNHCVDRFDVTGTAARDEFDGTDRTSVAMSWTDYDSEDSACVEQTDAPASARRSPVHVVLEAQLSGRVDAVSLALTFDRDAGGFRGTADTGLSGCNCVDQDGGPDSICEAVAAREIEVASGGSPFALPPICSGEIHVSHYERDERGYTVRAYDRTVAHLTCEGSARDVRALLSRHDLAFRVCGSQTYRLTEAQLAELIAESESVHLL